MHMHDIHKAVSNHDPSARTVLMLCCSQLIINVIVINKHTLESGVRGAAATRSSVAICDTVLL
jgi:hypothetical protein